MLETKIFHTNEIKEAAEKIREGECVSFPTETVYGLGADALNETAVSKVYQAKGRPSDNPLIVHVSSKAEVAKYAKTVPAVAEKLMSAFWPGPLTLIFQVKEDVFAPTVTAGLNSVAMRMPNNEATLQLIKEAGTPLVGPSANTSGKPSPTTAEHVYHDLKGNIAGILDDGETGVGLESTVLDITDPSRPAILRPGGVSKEALEQVIGTVYVDAHLVSADEVPKAPGMKYKHYSPEEPVVIVDGDDKVWEEAIAFYQHKGEKIGLLANEDRIARLQSDDLIPFSLGKEGNIEMAAHRLFAGLRYFETTNATLILAEAFPEKGLGIAYMNRLKKAAGAHFFGE
ncbi:translation factor SUA5 [Pisciglobus halotolerans]|uniref:Threonylcarbamoyl-AMP synthase n=1 Tax=Pisciglobus halotolerans TaxID=745365 RepID=A0A1I3C7S3_9LACT|nr:L-threonylcarbamoyladenylate synthase [Pisciglobus halotolerans]SFH70453.1 translation factor SUA5 [Pisciglobus halotolerans]